jgi:hypothetical protein
MSRRVYQQDRQHKLDLKRAGLNPHEALEFAKKIKIPIMELTFMDLLGTWQHLSIPVKVLTKTRI